MHLAGSVPLGNDAEWGAVPVGRGVYSLTVANAPPRLGQSKLLRRRLLRMARVIEDAGRAADSDLRFSPTGSDFESRWLLYSLARESFPGEYAKLLRLRPPYYLKAHLTNAYPRTFVTQRLVGGRALFFGPFRRRTAAERFEGEFLDFFRIRRCSENLAPSPDHPGCVYGEIGQCLRPCQNAVSDEEYRAEMARVLEALRSRGATLRSEIEQQRDAASESLEFESAAKLHQRAEKAAETMKLAEEPARDIDALRAVVIQQSAEPGHLELWLLDRGFLHRLPAFPIKVESPAPLDGRLREHIALSRGRAEDGTRVRADHLTLLARWWFSSWREGEMILTDGWDRLPLRRLVNAVSRVYKASEAATT